MNMIIPVLKWYNKFSNLVRGDRLIQFLATIRLEAIC